MTPQQFKELAAQVQKSEHQAKALRTPDTLATFAHLRSIPLAHHEAPHLLDYFRKLLAIDSPEQGAE